MNYLFSLILVGVVVSAGCRAKQSESTEEGAETRAASKSAKRSADTPAFVGKSTAAQPGKSEAVSDTAPKPATKRSPFEPLGQRTVGSDGLAVEAPVVEPALAAGAGDAPINPDDLPQEGDQIMLPPQMLGLLLPGLNPETIKRAEPINIRHLLEDQNIQITNYQQLVRMGLTNYQIIRAQKPETAKAAR